MNPNLNELYPHEFKALRDALRRDMHTQLHLSQNDQTWADWHKMNAWRVQRLLQTLNPK